MEECKQLLQEMRDKPNEARTENHDKQVNFTNFLKPGLSWRRKTKSIPFRGFIGPVAAADADTLCLLPS